MDTKESYSLGGLQILSEERLHLLSGRNTFNHTPVLKLILGTGVFYFNIMINSIIKAITTISGDTFLGKLAISAGALATAYFAPIVGLLFACFATTAIDMVYGIKVAKKLGKKITSRKNWKGTLIKMRDEFTIISLAHLLEFTTMGDSVPMVLSGGATVLITITELWSILENLNTLDPEGPWRILSKFLKKKGEDFSGMELDDLKTIKKKKNAKSTNVDPEA